MAEIRLTHYYECVECGRRFEDIDAFDLHIQSTPHQRDAVFVAGTPQLP